jgi:phenylacetate-CoA ligase
METIKRKGLDPKTLSMKTGLFGAEPWPETVRQALEENLRIQAYDIYGVMELIEPGVSGECPARKGLHIFEDHFLPEIVDPQNGRVLSEGQEGELVLTTLTTSAYPLLRYRTSDVTALHSEPCACGRTLKRMERVLRRTDQMISVRGINVFPEKITEVLSGIQDAGPGYSLKAGTKYEMNNQLTVQVETTTKILKAGEEQKAAFQETLQLAFRRALGLRVDVELKERSAG